MLVSISQDETHVRVIPLIADSACMADDQQPMSRVDRRDAMSPEQVMNEFLIALFLPGIITFCTLWAVFRLYLDSLLSSFGMSRLSGDPLPFIALNGGYARFFLLVILSTLVVGVYLIVYVRVFRPILARRGIVGDTE